MHTERDIARQQAALVAEHLDGFTIDTEWEHGNPRLTRADGAALFLHRGTYGAERGRLVISGSYPGTNEDRPYNITYPKITVKDDTPPDKVAQAIVRRLLPDYEHELARVKEVIKRNADAGMTKAHAQLRLTEVGVDFFRDGQGDIDGLRLTLNHDGSGVSLDSHNIPLDVVIRMIEAMKDKG